MLPGLAENVGASVAQTYGKHPAFVAALVNSEVRDDIWTWYDPTIRVPSIGGSGGAVDVLSQWTYTEPSPLRVGYFADEVFAMAAASPQPQRVMKITQLFWYRSTSAPKIAGSNYIASPFDDHDPDAAYLTLLHAQLQPEVIFEETLLKRGLDRFNVLVLVDCDVKTKP